ncbi:hypothetical protein LINGRAHAP2_LOCUS1673 [Linum grandiflorum]
MERSLIASPPDPISESWISSAIT